MQCVSSQLFTLTRPWSISINRPVGSASVSGRPALTFSIRSGLPRRERPGREAAWTWVLISRRRCVEPTVAALLEAADLSQHPAGLLTRFLPNVPLAKAQSIRCLYALRSPSPTVSQL